MTTIWAFANRVISAIYFLLQEDGFYLLQEDGHKIVLEDDLGWNFNNRNQTN